MPTSEPPYIFTDTGDLRIYLTKPRGRLAGDQRTLELMLRLASAG